MLRSGEVLPPPPPESKTEAEKFLAWLRARKEYSDNTLHRYLAEFRKLYALAAQMGKQVRELGYEGYLRVRERVDAKVPKLYLKYLYEVTGDESYMKLYSRLRVPNRKQALPEVLTKEQVERLLEECGREGFELKVLVALIYETGARVGEILRLRGRDIEFDERGARLWIRRSKSEPRVLRVALYAQLLATLIDARKPAPDEPIFTYEYNTFLNHLSEAWKRAGLPPAKRKFHVLRHTRATELLKSRVFTEKEMMLWFGWKTRSMIDVYAKVTMADVEQAYLAAVKGIRPEREEAPKARPCPRCGALNPPEAKFCLKCAAPLAPEAQKQASNLELMMQQLLAELEELKAKVKK